MRKICFSLLAAGLLLAGIFGAIHTARGQVETLPDGSQLLLRQVDGENVREAWAPPGAPEPDAAEALNSFSTSTPYCYQPDAKKNECFINWYSSSADSAPENMRVITTTIESKIMARHGGFFQTSMYVNYAMAGSGYLVPCGALGSGGKAGMGESYTWSIAFKDAAGSWGSNSGVIYCPAYIP